MATWKDQAIKENTTFWRFNFTNDIYLSSKDRNFIPKNVRFVGIFDARNVYDFSKDLVINNHSLKCVSYESIFLSIYQSILISILYQSIIISI